MAAVGLFTACDPSKSEKDFDPVAYEAGDLEKCITIAQTDADGNPAEDGNFFTYTTNPATMVTVYNYLSDGSENKLAYGFSGSFAIKPARGADPNQTFYIRTINSDNSEAVISKTYNVFVQTDLEESVRYLASNAYGIKVWKWDNTLDNQGVVWGNMGYCGGSGTDVGTYGNGQWWGVVAESETVEGSGNGFLQQLQHTHDGAYHGDGDVDNSYMTFNDEGVATTYDANGEIIRQAPYSVEEFNLDAEWRKGLLKTTAILWPYEINSGGNVPGEYEIVYLTPDKMTLVYPDGGAYGELGNWGEATFWHFCSNTDVEGMAVGGYEDASKDWTWDSGLDDNGNELVVWGNMGYCGGSGTDVGVGHNGQWWGVVAESETVAGSGNGFMQQLQHTNDGNAYGDESMDAYFTLTSEGTISRYAGDGSLINSGSFEFDASVANEWKVADLKTTAGTILFPYEINSGGNMPTQFDVVYLTGSKMCLVYPDGGAFGDLGNWGEATFWHFKVKEAAE